MWFRLQQTIILRAVLVRYTDHCDLKWSYVFSRRYYATSLRRPNKVSLPEMHIFMAANVLIYKYNSYSMPSTRDQSLFSLTNVQAREPIKRSWWRAGFAEWPRAQYVLTIEGLMHSKPHSFSPPSRTQRPSGFPFFPTPDWTRGDSSWGVSMLGKFTGRCCSRGLIYHTLLTQTLLIQQSELGL